MAEYVGDEIGRNRFRTEKSGVERILRELKEPGAEFSPMPFWFFNDTFDQEKIKAQLADYAEKGVNGFVLHPRIGIPEEMPYLSREYFQAVRFIVGTAAELGMKVILYDEGMYPSGSAHGMVVKTNPAYAARGIVLLDKERAEEKLAAEKDAETIVRLEDGRRILYGYTGGTIRGIHFGEDDGEAGAPKAADILNPLAVEEFIRLTHEKYYAELKEYFGNTVIAFFTDEPSALGRNAGAYRPWAKGLEKEIRAAGGRIEELEGLFAKKEKTIAGREDIAAGEDNETVRIYDRLIKSKLREVFYARLSGWCESHGIALMGHPAESDDIEEELYFHIPGQDLIMRRVSPETGGLREFDSVQAKLSADMARHLGRRRNANECFGVCCRKGIPWYMTAGDMKWYIDWLGLRGVNLYIPHAFYYSVAGRRKEERPPDVGPHNIWWSHYRKFSDYMKRLSYLMTDSLNGAEIAVLCDNNRVPYEEIACLYENQIEFNYLPAALLEQAEIRDGRVCIGEYVYKGVLNVLGKEYEKRFQRKLGEALVTIPEQSEESVLQEAVKIRARMGTDWDRTIEVWGEDSESQKGLRMVRLNKLGADMLLFGNEGKEVLRTKVTVPGMLSALAVDLWRGVNRKIDSSDGAFRLELEPRETLLVIPDVPEELTAEAITEESLTGEEREIGSRCGYPDWTDRFVLEKREENRAVYVLWHEWKGASEDTGFSVKAEEMVECCCNGRFVDVSFWGIHRFCLKECLKQGLNEIRLVVTGNAANLYENAGIAFGLNVCND